MIKFNPIYRVTIYSNTETVIIEDPITCHVSTNRGLMSNAVTANVEIYNLAPSTRKKIYQDPLTLDSSKWHYIHIEGGYAGTDSKTPMSIIFKGRVLQAYSTKDGGSTDVVTYIEAQALDIFDCQSSHTFKAGTSYKDVIKTCASDMPNIEVGNIGEIKGVLQTDTTCDGNSMEQISTITGGHAFVDNGLLNVLLNNEVIDVPVPVITDENSLLSTPIRKEANLEIKMLFEPNLIIGQLLEIKSSIAPDFNGQYKVVGINHDCLFSATQSGSRTTTVSLYIGPMLPNANMILSDGTVKNNFNKVKGENVSTVNYNTPTGFIRPVNGRITNYFGRRVPPTKGASSNHKGVDFGVPVGTPVKATNDGKIVRAGSVSGYGYTIIIDHGVINGNKYKSVYGHLSRFVFKSGKVKRGQVIAYSGGAKGAKGSGTSTGPHLHFEIRRNADIAIDPLSLTG